MSYSDPPMYISADDVRAANARRRGILIVPPAPPPVPMAVVRQQLRAKVSKANARKEVSAMLASAVARQRRRSTVYTSDHVSLRLQSPGEVRKDYLAAQVASAAPKSLVASALANVVPVNDRMAFGLASSADGNRVVSIMVPR